VVRAETRCLAALVRSDPDDDTRALTVSHLLAACLALVWLALVHFVPRPVAPPESRVVVNVVPPVWDILPSPPPELTRRPAAPAPGSDAGRTSRRIAEAFTAGPGPVGRRDVVHGVRVMPTLPTWDPLVRRVPLGDRGGAETPGRSRATDDRLSGTDIGVVTREGIKRADIAIMPPDVRVASGDRGRGDATEIGRSARAYAPQLQRCYLDEGLTRNPGLAGLVRLEIAVEAGRVVSARVVDRSWTGTGVIETESCLVRAVRGWRLGTSTGLVTLPFSFTSGTIGR
jgi:hypothetical protein